MSLFRDENPALGAQTSVKELSGYGTGNPIVSYFKPGTREILSIPLSATSPTTQWIFQAPWACQVVAAHFNSTTAGAASTLTVEKIMADAIAPAAANGTTIINVLASTVSLASTANTRVNVGPSAAAGSPSILNAGDQLAIFISATPTGLAGAYLQVEIVQIG